MAQANGMPSEGMYYEQGRKQAVRFAKGGNTRMMESAINQVRVAESKGYEKKGATAELVKEIIKDHGKRQAR